nr:hypothetical protein [Oscillospiraceae bacterium]
MAKNVELQERLNMRFLTVSYKEKQETYGTSSTAADTGSIALDILNLHDSVLEELLELTEPMMDLVDYLNKYRNPDNKTLGRMMTASKNIFRVVDLLQEVPPFEGQDFTWLDENLPKVFAPEKVRKAYTERKKETGELFIQAMCLVAQLGFGVRDFREALIPLVESLADEDISRNPKGFSQKFDSFFSKDEERKDQWMAFSNVSVEYVPEEKGIVRRMHYASFPSMFRSNLYEALAVGNAPRRCPICQKFFLTTNARRQKYCTGMAPDEYEGMTCVQVGNRQGREFRESAKDDPITVLYHRSVDTLDKRVERGTLDKNLAAKAKQIARDCRDIAIVDADYANEEYLTDMLPDALIAAAMRE